MDNHRLARAAVNLIAAGLARNDARAADPTVQHIRRLVLHQLPGVLPPEGERPLDAGGHARLAAAVAGEADADPGFADALAQAVQRAGVVMGAGASTRITTNSGSFSGNTVHGDMRVKHKQFHIGRFQFGTGGLVSAVVLLLALGGGTAAVVANAGKPVQLDTAVGRWEQPGSSPVSGIETKPTVLTVTSDGQFTFSLGISMTMPGAGDTPGVDIQCRGSVTPDGDHFTLRTTAGACGTFTAKPTPDGKIMDVLLSGGSTDGSLALTKVAAS